MIEGAWTYRYSARISRPLEVRHGGCQKRCATLPRKHRFAFALVTGAWRPRGSAYRIPNHNRGTAEGYGISSTMKHQSSCATNGCRTASSRTTTTSSINAAALGTRSSNSRGRSCPSDCAIGRIGHDQRTSVFRRGVAASCQALPPVEMRNSDGATRLAISCMTMHVPMVKGPENMKNM